MPRLLAKLGVPAVLLMVACAERSGAPAGVTTTIDSTGSTVQVVNRGNPADWTLEPVVRIGSVEGGPSEFGGIRSLLADAEHNVYIADTKADEIRVFDAAGKHLRTIGRRGSGPAEFVDLYSLAWIGDNIAALDPRKCAHRRNDT